MGDDATRAKACFKCGEVKLLAEFYRHRAMLDGYLNKCKVCTKKDVAKHREENLEKIRDYDVQRAKLPHRKEKAKRVLKEWRENNPDKVKEQRERYPERVRARNIVYNAIRSGKLTKQPCEKCGEAVAEAHHEDYSRPLDVNWLCKKHHVERQAEIDKLES